MRGRFPSTLPIQNHVCAVVQRELHRFCFFVLLQFFDIRKSSRVSGVLWRYRVGLILPHIQLTYQKQINPYKADYGTFRTRSFVCVRKLHNSVFPSWQRFRMHEFSAHKNCVYVVIGLMPVCYAVRLKVLSVLLVHKCVYGKQILYEPNKKKF